MKVALMGAGAVGCYDGAMLVQAGYQVTVVGRQRHVAAVQARGLLLETRTFTEAVRVDAMTDPSSVAGADIILVCVKTHDTSTAGHDMWPHLKRSPLILSLQNGMDSAERLQATLEQPVVPTSVYVAVDMPAPGHVRHNGRGEFVIGPSPASNDIAKAFGHAGIPTTVSENVVGMLWAKLISMRPFAILERLPRASAWGAGLPLPPSPRGSW